MTTIDNTPVNTHCACAFRHLCTYVHQFLLNLYLQNQKISDHIQPEQWEQRPWQRGEECQIRDKTHQASFSCYFSNKTFQRTLSSIPWVKVHFMLKVQKYSCSNVCVVSQIELGMQELLLEQHALQNKMSSFHSKLTYLEFHRCLECFPSLTMGVAGSTECRWCFQDKNIRKL